MEAPEIDTRLDQEKRDLQLIRKMKHMVDKGYDVELRKDRSGRYKALRVDKKIIAAE